MARDLRAAEEGTADVSLSFRRSLGTDMNTVYTGDRGNEYALAAGSPEQEYALAAGSPEDALGMRLPQHEPEYALASGVVVSELVPSKPRAAGCVDRIDLRPSALGCTCDLRRRRRSPRSVWRCL